MGKRIISAAVAVCLLFGSAAALPHSMVVSQTAISSQAAASQNDFGYLIVNDEVYGKGAKITSYTGTDKIITIPQKLGGQPVIIIGERAFYGNTDITTVFSMPDTLKRIGDRAFQGCTNLDTLNFSKSVTDFGMYTLSGTAWMNRMTKPDKPVVINGTVVEAVNVTAEEVTLSPDVKQISPCAFYKNSSIKKVTATSSLKSIGRNAFYETKNLESITLVNGLTSIGEYAFYNSGLTEITIPGSVKFIGNNCFSQCSELKKAKLPGTLKTISQGAFAYCRQLEECSIPSSVTRIKSGAFESCAFKKVYIPASVNDIDSGAFRGCTDMTELTFAQSNSELTIGGYAFTACSKLTSVVFPKSLKSIGQEAFNGCQKLLSYTIPASVETFGNHALGMQYVFKNGKSVWEAVGSVVINGFTGSKAQEYANETGIRFIGTACPHTAKKTFTATPTCDAPLSKREYCENCGKTFSVVNSSIKHNFVCGSWKFDTNNQEKAELLVRCQGCGYEKVLYAPLTEQKVQNATCTSAKKITLIYSIEDEGKTYSASTTYSVSGALAHSFKEPVWKWNGTAATAEFACEKCSFKETVKATVSKTTDAATCTKDGVAHYTASVVHNEVTFTDKKDAAIPATGHSFTSWKVFSSSATAQTTKRVCSKCNAEQKAYRIAGANRFETAVKISADRAAKATTVVLAYGMKYADALAGVPLAYAKDAPILLTNTNSLDSKTLAEIKRLGATNVIILGGEGAISKQVEDALHNEKIKTQRIAGESRFGTATAIAEQLSSSPADIFFVYGFNYADALSVSAVAAEKKAPIIYLRTDGEIDNETNQYLAKLKNKKCVKNAYVIGGEGVISDAMMKKAAKAVGVSSPLRLSGKNRYATCVKVNEKFAGFFDSGELCIAKGTDFPDALAGGVWAAYMGSPIMLADSTLVSEQKSYLQKLKPKCLNVFGGTGAVSSKTISLIADESLKG